MQAETLLSEEELTRELSEALEGIVCKCEWLLDGLVDRMDFVDESLAGYLRCLEEGRAAFVEKESADALAASEAEFELELAAALLESASEATPSALAATLLNPADDIDVGSGTEAGPPVSVMDVSGTGDSARKRSRK